MDRRNFIKDSCSICIGIAGLGGISTLLSSCSSMAVFKTDMNDHTIKIPSQTFTGDEKTKIVRVQVLPFDILLVKKSESEYLALEMKCTHNDNILVATKSGLTCNMHGSTFNLEGNVTNGPAIFPLVQFKTSVINEDIIIHLS